MIIMTRGLPASGKTTWAKEQVLQGNGKVKRVNKDELRAMVDASKHSDAREAEIVAIRDYLVTRWVMQGLTVIVDDTNLHPSHEERLRELAKELNVEFKIQDFTHVSLGTCLQRNRSRERQVPESWMFREWEKYLKPTQDWASQPFKAIICDLDGTLALLNGRNPYDASQCGNDELNLVVRDIWDTFSHDKYMKIIVSGRSDKHRDETERWLTRNWISYHALYMRKDGDSRPDEIVKREIYDEKIRGMYHVHVVIDDRPKVIRMWQYDLGLPVINVGYGIEF